MATPSADAVEALLAARNHAGAVTAATALLARAGSDRATQAAALSLRARAYEMGGRLREGIADLVALGALTPNDPRVFAELGVLLTQVGEMRAAAEAFSRAVQLDPSRSRAWNNFGNALSAIGERDAALRAFERAVQLAPDYALAHANRGMVLRDIGRWQEAEQVLERALQLQPAMLSALLTLGSIALDRGAVERAIEVFRRATAAAPRDVTGWMHLARALAERDDIAGARAAYATAAQCDPGLLRAHLGCSLSLPNVYRDGADMAAERAQFAQGLADLERSLPTIAAALPHERRVNGMRWSNFLLGYQGLDDRPLQQRYGALLTQVLAASGEPLAVPTRARLRVAFVSSFFRDSTVGRYFASWVTGLDRTRFEVAVFHLNPTIDPLAQSLRASADRFRDCPRWTPLAVAKALRADAPDIIVYPELGMDATTFVLGALRLAPLQVAAWGHPVTTGLPAIDLFLSSAAMEGAGADAHYSETLVRLPGLGTRYTMPLAPTDATRAQFGLPEGVPLLLCPQSLFKIQPDDDALVARVLRAVPDAVLVLFQGRNAVVNQRFLERLTATLRAAGVMGDHRVAVLGAQKHADYLRVNTLCDAMLDTLAWSGGNTALDAIASALPVVTLPGTYMRSRQTAGMYALMGIDALVARDTDDYVAIAARLVADRAFRAAQVDAIRERRARLFDDEAPIAALNAELAARAKA